MSASFILSSSSSSDASMVGFFKWTMRKIKSGDALKFLVLLMLLSIGLQVVWWAPRMAIMDGPTSAQFRQLKRVASTDGLSSDLKYSSPIDNDSMAQISRQKASENSSAEPYFSACMLTMDDNHYWKEFLAYHYTFLNLRRLIVAVDPRSKTSPKGVFAQWSDLIDITVWSDDDFVYDCDKYEDDLTDIHRCRQRRLYQKCSGALKSEEHTTWVAYIDVDEYIVPNWRAGPYERITNYDPQMDIFKIFDGNQYLNTDFNYSCFPMSRINVNVKESSSSEVFKDVPAGINATSLMTLRYRYLEFNKKQLPGKSMINLDEVRWKEIRNGNHNAHRPIKSQCDMDDAFLGPWDSPFLTYHYPGTLEAFQFRDDPRKLERRTADHYFEKFNGSSRGVVEDDSARFWIRNFVSKVGLKRAQQLLAGADFVGLEY